MNHWAQKAGLARRGARIAPSRFFSALQREFSPVSFARHERALQSDTGFNFSFSDILIRNLDLQLISKAWTSHFFK
tara:strand:- start:498 stop:725 length:228 start_codon:yes stop_codon:yes gene_type:complete